jgi:hypothetical protein
VLLRVPALSRVAAVVAMEVRWVQRRSGRQRWSVASRTGDRCGRNGGDDGGHDRRAAGSGLAVTGSDGLGLHGLSDLRGGSLHPEQPRPSVYREGPWGLLPKELPGGRT